MVRDLHIIWLFIISNCADVIIGDILILQNSSKRKLLSSCPFSKLRLGHKRCWRQKFFRPSHWPLHLSLVTSYRSNRAFPVPLRIFDWKNSLPPSIRPFCCLFSWSFLQVLLLRTLHELQGQYQALCLVLVLHLHWDCLNSHNFTFERLKSQRSRRHFGLENFSLHIEIQSLPFLQKG